MSKPTVAALMMACCWLMSAATQAQGTAAPTSASAGGKPVLAVIKFQDETGGLFLQGGVGRALTQMLTNELSSRAAFTVVERQKLRAVLEEQDLSASGRVSPETSIAIGKLTGAQYLVTGTVSAFEQDEETRYKSGFLGMGGRVETVSHGGYLAVDLRVIDTTTGEIAYSRTVEGRTAGSVKSGRTGTQSMSSIDDGPGSRAVRAAVIEIVDYLDCSMSRRDSCVADFEARERARVETTRKAVRIER